MQVHGFVAFGSGVVLHETRSTALDLNTASSLLLDVLDIRTTLTYHLSAEVETNDRLEVHGNLFLGPLTLKNRSVTFRGF